MAVSPSSPADDLSEASGQGSRSGLTMMCGAALLVLAVSLVGGGDETSRAPAASARPPQAQQAPQAPRPAASTPTGAAAGKHLPRSRPVRLRIPKISVDAPFTDLAIGPTGQLRPPPAADTNLVGWFAAGPSPGETGTSVIAGHVDTKTSAAVFADLGELEKGDGFAVRRADGRIASFEVDSVETFAKDDFPSERVYGDTPRALVRLITCAGDYDHSARDYTDNLVVFAHLK